MEINLGNRAGAGMGIGRDLPAAPAHGASGGAPSAARQLNFDSTFTVTHASVSAEEIAAAEIPEAALARDDALGRLIGAAFNLPAPPMPAFET